MGLSHNYSQFQNTAGPSYPPAAGYNVFGGLPRYSGYPPGYQPPAQHFPDRQMHQSVMGPLMPPRIPTPPLGSPMGHPVQRSHSPSPETVMPIGMLPKAEPKMQDTQTVPTSQQGTQTTPQRKRTSSRSSRRNSEEKAESQQDSKKEEGSNEGEQDTQRKQNTEQRVPRQG